MLTALALLVVAQTDVVIRTEIGDIEVRLEDKKAPVTAANFLAYVDRKDYDDGMFHRSVRTKPDNQPQSTVKIAVIQGGPNAEKKKSSLPPIALERTSKTGLKHVDGAISMARMSADSATSDFFICVGDWPSLDEGGNRNPDLQGFAAFGKVTRGMDVVKRIHESPTGPSTSTATVAAGNQRLAPPIKILSIRRK